MKTVYPFYRSIAGLLFASFLVYSSDSSSTSSEKNLITPSPIVSKDTKKEYAPDKFDAFSVIQKQCLKRVIFMNGLYAAGYGLLRGVVIPRAAKLDDDDITGSLKLMPLNFLSAAMMYVSLPMSTVASYKARNNYSHYYKEKTRNLTIPFLATGAALGIMASGISIGITVKDFRDNNEVDGSYNKYTDLMSGTLDAALLTWGGANVYSLIYIIVLGKKAEKNKLNTKQNAFHIAPFHLRDANGLMLSSTF